MKAFGPIAASDAGKVILARLFTPKNASLPIVVRVFGSCTDVTPVAPENAYPEIEVTPSGTTTEPTHRLLPVTTLSVMVKVPLVPQFTVVVTAACAGVRPKLVSAINRDARNR